MTPDDRDDAMLVLPPPDASGALATTRVREAAERRWAGHDRVSMARASEDHAAFGRALRVLKRDGWKVGVFVAAAVLAAIIVTKRLTPLYEATATLDLGRQALSTVFGPRDSGANATDVGDGFLLTQMTLIQSDTVLRPVAERFNLLDDTTGPNGKEARVVLKGLKVTRPLNSSLLQVRYRAADPRRAADVANEIANSYLKQTYTLRARSLTDLSSFLGVQNEELKLKMERSSAALADFHRQLDIIDPEQKSGILSARLLALNKEYADAQAERIRKDATFQAVSSGSIPSAEVSPQGEVLRRLVSQLEEAQQRFAVAKTFYGLEHPEYTKAKTDVDELQRRVVDTRTRVAKQVEVEYQQALTRERMLQNTVASTKDEFDKLSARSFEYERLRREAESDRQLYEELVRRIKEAGINAGFQESAIRIADAARPPNATAFPNLPLNVFLAFLSALMIGVGVVLGREYLGNSIQDAEQVEALFGVPVLGTVPSLKPKEIPMLTRRVAQESSARIQGYQDAIRALCYSILYPRQGVAIRSLLVTSAAPGEGKTTIALQLALAHAASGRKTLLVDSDSRAAARSIRGGGKGLVHVLRGALDWRAVILPSPALPHLHFLAAGASLWELSDHLDRRLAHFLESASAEYDLIIIDSPPLLGFAESFEMATVVDGVLVVACAEKTKRRTLGGVLQKLGRFGVNIMGVTLNRVPDEVDVSSYYRRYSAA